MEHECNQDLLHLQMACVATASVYDAEPANTMMAELDRHLKAFRDPRYAFPTEDYKIPASQTLTPDQLRELMGEKKPLHDNG